MRPQMSHQKISSIEDDIAVDANVLLSFAMIMRMASQGGSTFICSTTRATEKHRSSPLRGRASNLLEE